MRSTAPAVRPLSRISGVFLCLLAIAALCALLQAPAVRAATGRDLALSSVLNPSKLDVSASVKECITTEAERSATFVGEMTAIPGTAKMQMRVEVLEWGPQETTYHTVSAPGLGVWLSSVPGIKLDRNYEHVTNLTAPAFYRGAIRFRWLNAKGHMIASTELRTHRCEQPLPAPTATGQSGGEGQSGTTSTTTQTS
jgi:hypothetical protein